MLRYYSARACYESFQTLYDGSPGALVENDPEMYMYFAQMFEQQAPFAPPIGSVNFHSHVSH